jgi:hypothetical protein
VESKGRGVDKIVWRRLPFEEAQPHVTVTARSLAFAIPTAHAVERSRGRLWRELWRRLGPEPVRVIFPGWSRTRTALLSCSLLARSTYNLSKDGLPNGDGEQRDDLHNLCILPLLRPLCGLALFQDQGRLSLCSAYSIRFARTFLSAGVPKC